MRVAIGAGHRHTVDLNRIPVDCGGGNCFEFRKNGLVTFEFFQMLKQGGYDVRCYTPGQGLGLYPGNYNDAAASIMDWVRAGWVPDVFLEFHSEGTAAGVRGSFVIYPDNGNDVDSLIRDHGSEFAKAVEKTTGLPVTGDGTMSEQKTGVGLEGYRLGVFAATAELAESTTRFIFEIGTHSDPDDTAIMSTPDFPKKAADGTYRAFVNMFPFGVPVPLPPPVIVAPDMGLNAAVKSRKVGETWSLGNARVTRLSQHIRFSQHAPRMKYADIHAAMLPGEISAGASVKVDALIVNDRTWFLTEDGARVFVL